MTLDAAPITIRLAYADDFTALGRLAALDSAPIPPRPVLLAEVDGELRAALSLRDGSAVADPFHLTNDLVALLRARAVAGASPVGECLPPTPAAARAPSPRRAAPWLKAEAARRSDRPLAAPRRTDRKPPAPRGLHRPPIGRRDIVPQAPPRAWTAATADTAETLSAARALKECWSVGSRSPLRF